MRQPNVPFDSFGLLTFIATATVAFTLLPASSASAAIFTVDRFDDPFPDQVCSESVANDCSLRDAVMAANASPGPDAIVLPAGLYHLTRVGDLEDAALTGDLDVTDNTIITGAGEDLTVIDAGGQSGLGDRVFELHAGSEVILEDLTVRGGYLLSPAPGGGGLRTQSDTTLNRVRIRNNESWSFGGGVASTFSLEVNDSSIEDNRAERAAGIDVGLGSSLNLSHSSVVDNEAHGTAGFGGGGILIFGVASMATLDHARVTGNTTMINGGGLYSEGTLTILDSVIEGNHANLDGGGVYQLGSTVFLERTLLKNNTAGGDGGGLRHLAIASVASSTFVGNSATRGGAIFNAGARLVAQNSTIVGNSGEPAIYAAMDSSNSLTFVTLIAEAIAVGGDTSDVGFLGTAIRGACTEGPDYQSLGGNSESPGATCFEQTDDDLVDLGSLDLFVLGDYGGPTATAPPKLTSELIDVASDCPIAVDQRGLARPASPDGGGGACDSGAAEVQQAGIESSLVSVDDFELASLFGWTLAVE